MEQATWCGKTVGGGNIKCKWCKRKKEFIKTIVEAVIWFCPNCDNRQGTPIPKGGG